MQTWRKVGNEGCSEDLETRRQDYNLAKIAAKRAIFKAKSDEQKKFCEDLEREDEKRMCLGWPSRW